MFRDIWVVGPLILKTSKENGDVRIDLNAEKDIKPHAPLSITEGIIFDKKLKFIYQLTHQLNGRGYICFSINLRFGIMHHAARFIIYEENELKRMVKFSIILLFINFNYQQLRKIKWKHNKSWLKGGFTTVHIVQQVRTNPKVKCRLSIATYQTAYSGYTNCPETPTPTQSPTILGKIKALVSAYSVVNSASLKPNKLSLTMIISLFQNKCKIMQKKSQRR